jgi:hypothetical protein
MRRSALVKFLLGQIIFLIILSSNTFLKTKRPCFTSRLYLYAWFNHPNLCLVKSTNYKTPLYEDFLQLAVTFTVVSANILLNNMVWHSIYILPVFYYCVNDISFLAFSSACVCVFISLHNWSFVSWERTQINNGPNLIIITKKTGPTWWEQIKCYHF